MSISGPKNYAGKIPGAENDPLFTAPRHGQYLPLTETIVRKHLKRVLKALGGNSRSIQFTLLGDLGPLGRITMESLFRP